MFLSLAIFISLLLHMEMILQLWVVIWTMISWVGDPGDQLSNSRLAMCGGMIHCCKRKKEQVGFIWLHEQRFFRSSVAEHSLPQCHFLCAMKCLIICANTCLSLNFPQVLGTQWNCSKLLFSWHPNWKTYWALIVWVQLPSGAVEFWQGLWAGWVRHLVF